jgi:hypothetical protein
MLLIFFCGFIVEPDHHSHNLRAKKMRKMALC